VTAAAAGAEGLPSLADDESFRLWRNDPLRALAVARDIARSHGLPFDDAHLFATGTNLVVGLGERFILKIFPPMLRGQFAAERGALSILHGRIGIPVPEFVTEGERDGWPYLVMTRLAGVLGSEAWPSLPEPQKERILFQIGRTIAEVQRVPPGGLAIIQPRWDDFFRAQVAGCRTRHERLGLPAKFLDGIEDLLRDAAAMIPKDASPVILTGEYIPENFLLGRLGNEWHLAGLIDFGDVRTGWREYDLSGPSAFMAAGRPGRVNSLLAGFGYSPAEMTFALKRRLMALMLLHRFSDPLRHLCLEGWQEKADDLLHLQEIIWPTD
jgi:hygromycin-B 7''-O-kinase